MAKKKKKKTGKNVAAHQPQGLTADKVVWWCVHLMVFLVPLAISNLTMFESIIPTANIPVTYDQFDIVKVFTMRALALVGLGAWAWARLIRGGTYRRTTIDWLILAFLAWVVLSTIFSIHPPTAVFGKYRRFEGLISFITYAVIFFLTVQSVDRPAKMRKLARTLVLSGFLVGLYGVCQYVGIDLIKWGSLPFETNRAFATYGNPDLLGGYLMFPLPIALALALSEKDTRWRAFYWIAFLTLMGCWITAFTRGAWIGGTVGLAVLIFMAFRKKTKIEKTDWGFLGAGAAAAAVIVIRSLFNPNSVLNVWARIVSIFKFGEGSALTRFQIWESAIAAVKASPIVGHGADTFRLLFPKFKPVEYVEAAGYLSVADNVHNYPLQAASGLGIPGVILLYAVFIRGLIASAKDVLSTEKGERLVLAGFWSAVVAYLVHLTFGLSVTGSTFLLWLCIGVLLVPSAKSFEIPPAKSVWRTVVAIVVVLVIVFGSVLNVRYLWADRYHLLSKIGVLSTADRIQASKRSIEWNPYNDMYRAELGLAYMELTIGHINQVEQARAAGADPESYLRDARGAFLLAEQTMRDVIEWVPPEYDNYVFLSNLYNLAGTYLDPAYLEDAIEVANEGIEVEPYGPAIRVQAGRAYIALERYEEAIEECAYAAEMDPRYVEPRILLGQAYTGLDRLDEALAILEEALGIEPANQSALNALAHVQGLIDAAGTE